MRLHRIIGAIGIGLATLCTVPAWAQATSAATPPAEILAKDLREEIVRIDFGDFA